MADSWNWPALINKIAQDVPFLQRALNALLKQDPTSIEDAPSGAKRLYEVSSGKWQWQEYNGSSWAAVPFLQHNVDQLDGYHAAITPAANTVAVRNASGLLQDSITGNAATASTAVTLSQTLAVNKGGTGATTSEAARTNLGVPPTSHTSTATTYGVGNSTQYGHLKLSDATDSVSSISGGVAATPAAVKAAKEAADAAQSSADAAMTKASTLATSSTPGIVKPGTGMTVDTNGALNADTASTSKAGIVQLNNTVTSTSTTQAATANAVKMAYDKAVEATSKAGLPLGYIYAWPYKTPMDGSIQINGQLLNRDLYADLFAYANSHGQVISESEWQSKAAQQGGYCAFYSSGDGSTTFRAPKFAPYQKLTMMAIVCVVAFGVATNVGSVDVANVMSAVGQVQSEVEEVRTIAEESADRLNPRLLGTRSTAGVMTIPDATVGRLLIIGIKRKNAMSDNQQASFFMQSGTRFSCGTGVANGAEFRIGKFYGSPAENSTYVDIISESTVIIDFKAISDSSSPVSVYEV